MRPECSQITARNLLKPAGYTCTETVKQSAGATPALRRIGADSKLTALLLPFVTGATENNMWAQFWRDGRSVRLAVIDVRTQCIVRVMQLQPGVCRLFPPADTTDREFSMGAGF